MSVTSVSMCQFLPPPKGLILRQRGIKLGHLINKKGKKNRPDSYLKKEKETLQLLQEFTGFDINLDTFWESQSSGEAEDGKDANVNESGGHDSRKMLGSRGRGRRKIFPDKVQG